MGAWRTLMLPSRRMPAMKPVGERSAGNPHAAFDERGKRPSITWGDSCGMAKRAAGPSLSGRVILVEGPVDDRGADLEHQMRSSRRPTHLLVGAHPPVQQPMHRTLGGRRRYWLVVSPGGGIIDDQTGLPGYVSLEATKHACHLTRGRSVRRYRFGRGIEYHQGVSDEIERPLYLPVPETPTDMLDGVGQAGSFRAVARRGVRPALGGLSDMLNAQAALWIRRAGPPASISPGSNANTVPPRWTTPNRVGRPCGDSRSPMAGSANSCAQPALAWRSCSSSAATFPSASKSETSTSGPSSSSPRNAST